jgi:mycofactocin biosynthesis protein MftB
MLLDRALELHPQVALRPEPFGALAYHYGNRRLVFLKHPDVVTVARHLGEHPSLQATLEQAFTSLESSNIVQERDRP